MIRGVLFVLLVGAWCAPRAEAALSVVLTPRFEGAQGTERDLSRRGLLRAKVNGDWGPYSFYLEGFGEFESVTEERDRRRLDQESVLLQEAFVEFKLDRLFVRAGKQSMRWSEMWVRPSLDVWTGRRWNRFLFDPQPEQLSHSGGVSASFVGDGYAIDGVIINQIARDEFPRPMPRYVDTVNDEEVSLGLRASLDLGGFGLRALSARHNWKTTTGLAVNYAFEKAVPKMEIGYVQDRSNFPLGQEEDVFVATGVDLFIGDWTLQPQATWFDFGDGSQGSRDYQTLIYLGGNWVRGRFEVQFQTFGNTATSDYFLNVFCAYNLKDWMQLGSYVQNYQGTDGGLFELYRNATGGWAAGVRLEMNSGFSFWGG